MQGTLATVLLLGTMVVALSSAFPARFFFESGPRQNSPSFDTVTTVDCSNREAVRFVSKTHANFRCVYPQQRQRQTVNRHNSPRFPAGLQSASLIRGDPNICPTGKIFVPEIGICLTAHRPTHTAPLESDNLVIEDLQPDFTAFASNFQYPSDCKLDEVYNSELSMCMEISIGKTVQPLATLNLVRAPLPPLKIQSFSSSVESSDDCDKDEIYVPEISSCININHAARPLSASLVRDAFSSSFADRQSITQSDCGDNELFVPEIGICLPAHAPSVKKPIVSDSLIRDPPRPIPFEIDTSCGEREFFSPEIGICMPIDPPGKPVDPLVSSSLVKEPIQLEIQAFETSKSQSDCGPGTIFVPEIAECLPI